MVLATLAYIVLGLLYTYTIKSYVKENNATFSFIEGLVCFVGWPVWATVNIGLKVFKLLFG